MMYVDKIMIVAHPDDEALFGGAELLSHPDEYKVVVIDEYHNDIRRREFLDSMRFIGVHEYEHWTGYKHGEDYCREKLIYELLRVLRERKYTKIVTHGTNGFFLLKDDNIIKEWRSVKVKDHAKEVLKFIKTVE